MKAYLAGPMSGIAQFNFPAFYQAAKFLRELGWDIVSPAELDALLGIDKQALASAHGAHSDVTSTWGDLLARDVKLIADTGIEAIIFLPGWSRSRGARLEAMVGLLQDRIKFFELYAAATDVVEIRRSRVAHILMGTFL